MKRVAVIGATDSYAWQIKKVFRQEKQVQLVDLAELKDILVVCGGDGFLLATARKYLDTTAAFFGINLGTVGFLMNEFGSDDAKVVARKVCDVLAKSDYKKMSYALLTAQVDYFDKPSEQVFAINDFSIERQADQTARLEIIIDGQELPVFSGDGLLVGTPAGSTAYTLSAGGTPIDHGANCYILTPNNPQRSAEFANLSVPLVLAADRVLEIRVAESSKRPAKIVVDGVSRPNLKSVRISIDPAHALTLLWLSDWNYFERLSRKVIGIKERRR